MDCIVTLDDEMIHFEGNTPASVEEALGVLENVLREHGKTIRRIFVDGQPFWLKDTPMPLSSIGQLQCTSQVYDGESMRQIFHELRQKQIPTDQMLAWDFETLLEHVQKFVNALQVFLEKLNERMYSVYLFNQALYGQCIDLLVSCLEKKDIGTLFDLLKFSIDPLISETESQCCHE